MKSLRLRIAVWSMCATFFCAPNSVSSIATKQEPLASNSNAQDPKETHTSTESFGGIEILSDTQGVDFGPYVKSMLKLVKENWLHAVPQSAQGPRKKQGEVCIEFAVLGGGKTKFIKLVQSTGDIPMDRAAWAGIQDSRFSPLPAEYSGKTLILSFRFSYNAKSTDDTLQYRD
jgi:TonB family protein